MTRRSIVGPLLLIALGALFLANTLNPEMPLFRLVAEYWPFLLIGWGALRLIEILALAALGKPYPHGLGGGEIAVIVLICVMGSGMYSFQRHFNPRLHIGPWGPRTLELFGEEHEYSVQPAANPAAVSHLVVDYGRGNVRITGGDGPGIQVSGRKTVRAYDRSAADEADRRTPVEITNENGRAVIRNVQNRGAGNIRVSTDLEIAVPRGVDVEVRGQFGDVELRDVGKVLVNSDNAGVRIERAGDVRVDARRSDIIRAVGVNGNVELDSRGGDIELENVTGEVRIRGSYSGSLQFQNLAKPLVYETRQTELRVAALPGRIHMDLGEFDGSKLVGPVRMVTGSRDIEIDDVTNSVEIETERGDIEIRAVRTPMTRIEARSRTGDIAVAIPEKASFLLEASTERGEAHNEFGPAVTVSSEGASATMKGGVGDGPLVRMSTGRGSISVRKAEGKLQETRL